MFKLLLKALVMKMMVLFLSLFVTCNISAVNVALNENEAITPHTTDIHFTLTNNTGRYIEDDNDIKLEKLVNGEWVSVSRFNVPDDIIGVDEAFTVKVAETVKPGDVVEKGFTVLSLDEGEYRFTIVYTVVVGLSEKTKAETAPVYFNVVNLNM